MSPITRVKSVHATLSFDYHFNLHSSFHFIFHLMVGTLCGVAPLQAPPFVVRYSHYHYHHPLRWVFPPPPLHPWLIRSFSSAPPSYPSCIWGSEALLQFAHSILLVRYLLVVFGTPHILGAPTGSILLYFPAGLLAKDADIVRGNLGSLTQLGD